MNVEFNEDDEDDDDDDDAHMVKDRDDEHIAGQGADGREGGEEAEGFQGEDEDGLQGKIRDNMDRDVVVIDSQRKGEGQRKSKGELDVGEIDA